MAIKSAKSFQEALGLTSDTLGVKLLAGKGIKQSFKEIDENKAAEAEFKNKMMMSPGTLGYDVGQVAVKGTKRFGENINNIKEIAKSGIKIAKNKYYSKKYYK